MRPTIVGTGYVGLVSGTCFAEIGNTVRCVDVDTAKIAGLQRGILPICEPGLAAMVAANAARGSLRFATDLRQAISDARVAWPEWGSNTTRSACPPPADRQANARQ